MDNLEIILLCGSALMMIIGIITFSSGCSSHFYEFIYNKKDEIREFQKEIELNVNDFKREIKKEFEEFKSETKEQYNNYEENITYGLNDYKYKINLEIDNNRIKCQYNENIIGKIKKDNQNKTNEFKDKFSKIKYQFTKNGMNDDSRYPYEFPFFYSRDEEIDYIDVIKKDQKEKHNDPKFKGITIFPMYEQETIDIWDEVYRV